jgi:hypothetical protein
MIPDQGLIIYIMRLLVSFVFACRSRYCLLNNDTIIIIFTIVSFSTSTTTTKSLQETTTSARTRT